MNWLRTVCPAAFSVHNQCGDICTKHIRSLSWPRDKECAEINGVLIYYQPQLDEWKDYNNLTARMAFSLTPKNEQTGAGCRFFILRNPGG